MAKRVAAIYDIHGNLPALEAVLQDIEAAAVDVIVVGGDLAWGPEPAPVMEKLISLGDRAHFVMGNADREVIGRFGEEDGLPPLVAEVNLWCADQLRQEQLEFLRNMQQQVTVDIDGLGETLFVHGSPRTDEEAIRIGTPDDEIVPMLADVAQRVIVCGHTHIQFDRTVGQHRIVNAGSVGLQSRAPGACWALLGPDVELRVVPYDREAAAEQIRRSGVPHAEVFAEHILNPPHEGP